MSETSQFQWYKRVGVIKARPYILGESLEGISVAPGERPRHGGMIARDDHGSQWYITPEYFQKNYTQRTDDE